MINKKFEMCLPSLCPPNILVRNIIQKFIWRNARGNENCEIGVIAVHARVYNFSKTKFSDLA